jgi:hypothetical protein
MKVVADADGRPVQLKRDARTGKLYSYPVHLESARGLLDGHRDAEPERPAANRLPDAETEALLCADRRGDDPDR